MNLNRIFVRNNKIHDHLNSLFSKAGGSLDTGEAAALALSLYDQYPNGELVAV